MTVTFGYWMIPLLITIAAFWWSSSKYNEAESGGYISFPNNLFEFLAACLISTASWLIYFAIVLFVKGAWL